MEGVIVLVQQHLVKPVGEEFIEMLGEDGKGIFG